jgi:hypothetical protein
MVQDLKGGVSTFDTFVHDLASLINRCVNIASNIFYGEVRPVRSPTVWFNQDCTDCKATYKHALRVYDDSKREGAPATSLLIISVYVCLEHIQKNFLRSILSVGKSVPWWYLLEECGLEPLQGFLVQMCITFLEYYEA